MTQISAKIVADSKNQFGNRLTTFVLTFPRYILAELNTHRMLSKNSASSRAIPFKKMVRSVHKNPFIPIAWMKDHSGMQGSEYFIGWRVSVIKFFWILASKFAIVSALILNKMGLTKQLVNRILEPFMWHTVILTGTEFENFFSLRCSEYADIHIQKLAYSMLEAYNASTPTYLKDGAWHVPFGDKFDEDQLFTQIEKDHGIYDPLLKMQQVAGGISEKNQQLIDLYKVKIAIARCARVSYTVVGEEGKPDNYENDIKLFERLAKSGHYSPFEHAAKAMNDEEYAFKSSYNYDDKGENPGVPYEDQKGTWGWSGNFRGFVQFRKTLTNENRRDARVVQK